MQATRSTYQFVLRRPFATGIALVAPLCAAALVACGGSSSGMASGTSAAGSETIASGTITGFGSVFVNGIEYDTSNAAVTDDLGNAQPASVLKLGMQVDLAGQDPASNGIGSAATIVYGSTILGLVSAVNATDASSGTLTVLGQEVDVNANTVFDSTIANGIGGVTPGSVVEVFALYDTATSRYVASRIGLVTGATMYKLRGSVSNLNTETKTFNIGAALIDYSAVTTLPDGFFNGAIVTTQLQTTMGPSAWLATGMLQHMTTRPGVKVTVHVRGLISAESNSAAFTLDGWPIDASNAVFPSGQQVIVPGALVQVDGIMTNGAISASTVDIQQPGSHGGLDFQVHGPIDSVDTTAQTFVLRGQTVSYAGNVTYTGGSVASIVAGTHVMVQGTLTTDGSSVQAVMIRVGV